MTTLLRTTDTVFATVFSGGNTLVKLTLSGFGSMAELMRSVCSQLTGVGGLVTVELRNSSMGWLERRSLKLNRISQQPVQLTLF